MSATNASTPHPLFVTMTAALTAKGYTVDVGEYLTAGGTAETRMYVSHLNGAIRKSAAKVTIGDDSRPADVKAIYAIVTLAARGL
jgi:hypothetical protein